MNSSFYGTVITKYITKNMKKYNNINFKLPIKITKIFILLLLVTGVNAYSQEKADTVKRREVLELPINTTVQANSGVSPKVMNGYGKIQTLVASPAPATLGATIGGAKDIGYIRNLINEGEVPKFLDFSPEGLYSEHDIPSATTECTDKLCLSLGYGYAPTADDNSNSLFVHLSFSSGIKPNEFKRPALQLCVALDRSGSMNDFANGKNKVTKFDAMKIALNSLLGKLREDDYISLVTFENSAETILPLTQATPENKIRIAKIINELKADGGTNIEAGLQTAYNLLFKELSQNDRNKRILLFTDAQPNVGATDSASFCGLIDTYSKQNIGITAFGVGLDFGQELAYKISNVRGGNYFFLENTEKISKTFDTEFDYLVTPIVYDLKVKLKTPEGMKLKAVYGLPTWKEGDIDANLEIPTVFFSSNRGAIILRYEKDNNSSFAIKRDAAIASGQIFYTEPNGKNFNSSVVVRNQAKATLVPGTQFYTHDGMKKAVALTNIFFGLKGACLLNTEGKKEEALNLIKRAKTLAMVDNLYLGDEGLKNEITLLERLSKNIENGSSKVQKISYPNR